MITAGYVFIAMLAALGVALSFLELWRILKARKNSYICVCFKEEFDGDQKPDVIYICRTELEQEEILRRVCDGDERKAYINYK